MWSPSHWHSTPELAELLDPGAVSQNGCPASVANEMLLNTVIIICSMLMAWANDIHIDKKNALNYSHNCKILKAVV